jgi:phospholipase C
VNASAERWGRRNPGPPAVIYRVVMDTSPAASALAQSKLTRRSLLRGAAGGAALIASSGLPAWAKPVTGLGGVRKPDSLPFPHLPAGTASMPKIDHIVMLMMENHSFDNLLGMVPYQVPGRELVDGLTRRHGRFENFNSGAQGQLVYAGRSSSPCQLQGEPTQSWDASHQAYDNGRNDGFVKASGAIAMRFWDQHDLPFTYSLVKHFPLGQRYFCSVLAQTDPNRRYFFTGTSSGLTATNTGQSLHIPAANGTIWDRLDAHKIDWGIYYQDDPTQSVNLPSWLLVPGVTAPPGRATRAQKMPQFYADAAAGRLPRFTFLDPQYGTTSEENPQDIEVGERFVASIVNALMHAPTWKNTALFITYDEHGGYYDHVPPPPAIKPDGIAPIPAPGQPPLTPGAFNRYGFRVPLIVVSPWAKANYVSSVTQDHTSITAFIERKWNLPAMTFRDANAQPMTDYFDFSTAAFATPPKLALAPGLGPGLAQCHAAGLSPPLPGVPPPKTA